MAFREKRAAGPMAAAMALLVAATPAAAYTVYISNEKGNSITVMDSTTLEVLQTIPVGQRPRGIMLTNDGKHLLICASDDDTVQVLDVGTREIVGDLPSGPDPELLNLHPAGSPVYVANEDDSLLTVIDLAEKKVLAEINMGSAVYATPVPAHGTLFLNNRNELYALAVK